MFKLKNIGFTLIEIMAGILIFSIVIIGGFQALTSVTIGKVKLMSSVNNQKQIIYFQEKLFDEIKKGGLIDFEEYFNRKVVGTNFASGHYNIPTGFGNYGSGGNVGTSTFGNAFYQCRSGNGSANDMSSGTLNPSKGCYNSNFNTYGAGVVGKAQRYGQYSFQFIDYNSNFDADLGDEDGINGIIGDDDDEYLGDGPDVFTGGIDIKELYLISGNKKTRTMFRWNIKIDPSKPTTATCNISGTNVITGSGCLGTIEMLKLEGKDYGFDHVIGGPTAGESDGVVDTWVVHKDFGGGTENIAGSGAQNFWLPLFPDDINVSKFEIYLYPNKDYDLAWKSSDNSVNLAPYVRLNLEMGPSRKIKKKIKGNPKNIKFSTTISLTDIFSK